MEWNLILIFTHLKKKGKKKRKKNPNIWFSLKWNLIFTQEKKNPIFGSNEWNLIFTHIKK